MKAEVITSKKEKLAKTMARLEKRQKIINDLERKSRLRRIIELGDQIVRAGLEDLDNEVLLGALLEVKELSSNKGSIKKWAEKREAWVNLNQPQRLIVSFEKEPSAEAANALRSKKFRWNSFRQEWYGFGRKDELQILVGKDNAKITEVSG